MLPFVLLERGCGKKNSLKTLKILSFSSLRVKIFIIKNCGRALKGGKTRFEGDKHNKWETTWNRCYFGHPKVVSTISAPYHLRKCKKTVRAYTCYLAINTKLRGLQIYFCRGYRNETGDQQTDHLDKLLGIVQLIRALSIVRRRWKWRLISL